MLYRRPRRTSEEMMNMNEYANNEAYDDLGQYENPADMALVYENPEANASVYDNPLDVDYVLEYENPVDGKAGCENNQGVDDGSYSTIQQPSTSTDHAHVYQPLHK